MDIVCRTMYLAGCFVEFPIPSVLSWSISSHHHRCAITGNGSFAVCLGHTVKPRIHSAKCLPSVTLGKGHSAKISSAN